jgi:hypothetical protein
VSKQARALSLLVIEHVEQMRSAKAHADGLVEALRVLGQELAGAHARHQEREQAHAKLHTKNARHIAELVTPRPTGTVAKPEILNKSAGWNALLAMPGVESLHAGTRFWQLEIARHYPLGDVKPLLEAVLKQHPKLPQFWDKSLQDQCFYGRDPGPNEAHGVYG